MVKLSKPAKDDLKQIHEFIAQDSLFYAKEVVQSILKHIKQLQKFPDSGRVVPELNTITLKSLLK